MGDGKYRFREQINLKRVMGDQSAFTMKANVSGEITAQKTGYTLGAVDFDGSISRVWLSVAASGKDDSNTLELEADVFINGTTCLTTKPKIAHVSGEASQQKTTLGSAADTGITEDVLLATANSFNAGDVLTYNFELTRTSSPTTEMKAPCLVVELMPNK